MVLWNRRGWYQVCGENEDQNDRRDHQKYEGSAGHIYSISVGEYLIQRLLPPALHFTRSRLLDETHLLSGCFAFSPQKSFLSRLTRFNSSDGQRRDSWRSFPRCDLGAGSIMQQSVRTKLFLLVRHCELFALSTPTGHNCGKTAQEKRLTTPVQWTHVDQRTEAGTCQRTPLCTRRHGREFPPRSRRRSCQPSAQHPSSPH